jgi:hypothetical protein
MDQNVTDRARRRFFKCPDLDPDCDTIIPLFDSYFGNLDLLKLIFIFFMALSVSSVNRYKKVTLERNDNRYSRVKINVLTTN